MYVIMVSQYLQTTSGLSIVLHGKILLLDATSYDNSYHADLHVVCKQDVFDTMSSSELRTLGSSIESKENVHNPRLFPSLNSSLLSDDWTQMVPIKLSM